MKRYDPGHAPEPERWLKLSEGKRIRFVRDYHVQAKSELPSVKVQAGMHVIIENQITGRFEPNERAVIRLLKQGFSCHDAVHAIGSAVAECLFEASKMQPNAAPDELQAQMTATIE